MSSILKVDQLQDSGGNEIITSNGSGTITVNNQTFKNGITMVDQWRLTTSITADTNPLTGVFERVDETTYGGIGTGMSESSGDWTFPSTGIYLILIKAGLYADGDSNIAFRTYMYDGSTYNLYDEISGGSETGIGRSAGFGSIIVDVTDTSTIKAQFRTVSFSNTNQILLGDTNYNRSSFTFIRLGDT